MVRFFQLLGLAVMFPICVMAQAIPPETALSAKCPITPSVAAISYPGAAKIPTTNNLVTPTGKSDAAAGQLLYVSGKVIDQNCVPMRDVVVELWQPDPFSQFAIPDASDMANPIAMFAGAGKTYTAMDGTFNFISLFPGTIKICKRRDAKGRCIQSIERAPFLNIRITDQFIARPLMAGLFFENDRRNSTDPIFSKLSKDTQQRITLDILPSAAGDFNSGIRAYVELVVQAKPHFHGY